MNRSIQLLIALLITVGLSMSAQGQSTINDHPGFVDFSTLSGFAGAEPTVQISLKTPLLNMVTNLLKQEDEQAASFVSKLLRVNVNVFESRDIDVDEIASSMAVLADELDAQGWERVVRVREDENHVDIYFPPLRRRRPYLWHRHHGRGGKRNSLGQHSWRHQR
jgi:hypothetical protein